MLEGDSRPRLLAAGQPKRSRRADVAEERLLALIDGWGPDVVAIDAPLTLPPCLTCPAYCRGPGPLCELQSARDMWAAERNPVSQRPCEVLVEEQVGERPLPTMQLGVITGRAVALSRKLANRGRTPSVMQRGEILEVYPRATMRQLSTHDGRLRPRDRGEPAENFRARVLSALEVRVDELAAHPELWTDGHVFDALIAAYTAWLAPNELQAPPSGFNLASGWIWFPKGKTDDAVANGP